MCFHLYLKRQAQQFTFETESSLLYGRGGNVKGVEVSEQLAGQCHGCRGSTNPNFESNTLHTYRI